MFQPKIILIIMDGWGYSSLKGGNAILQAAKPNFDMLWQNYPHALIEAAGEPVGLPWGSIGSSEVGHLVLGSGRIIDQDLPRVSKAIASGWFYKNPAFLGALNHVKKFKSQLHLVGLVSAGGVHSHIDHVYAILEMLNINHFHESSFIHMFTDGRDTPQKVARLYVDKLEQRISSLKLNTKIATVIGRYYAMDRDSHWNRTFAAYNCMVNSKGFQAKSAKDAIVGAYLRDETDEFIKPTIIMQEPPQEGYFEKLFAKKIPQEATPTAAIRDNDAIIFFNFRPERLRQLTETFLLHQANFVQKKMLKNLYTVSMVEYEKFLPIEIALPPEKINSPLAKILSEHKLSQIHLAETEKYAHVTYFFDGMSPVPNPLEEWVVVPSPKVATYDKKPEMSAAKITDKLASLAKTKKYDFVLINFANADLVGHTGNLAATIMGVEAIDRELGRLLKLFPQSIFLITADHGNAEKMINSKGEVDTEHSVSPVPFILAGPEFFKKGLLSFNSDPKPIGILADIAPTVLCYLGIAVPPEMTGYSLIEALT